MSKSFVEYQAADLTNILGRAFDDAYLFQKRRHDQWEANYTLYRHTPKLNRFTQRQSVCLPLMKATVSTVLSTINQPPSIRFYTNDNDDDSKQKQIYLNGVWDNLWQQWRGVIIDRTDKKNAALYGRGIKMFAIQGGIPVIRALDPYDLLIDPSVDPVHVDATANYMIHVNIKQTKWEIENNPWFDQTEVHKCLDKYNGFEGGQTSYDIENAAKNRRIQDMGYSMSDEHALTEIVRRDFYMRLYSKDKDKAIIFWIPCIENHPVACLPLEDVIGHTSDSYWDEHYPIDTWTDDSDLVDFWSDGVADTVRDSHRLINSWWSQEVENRTLKNNSMFFYNSTITPEFIPQTFEPYPWAFFPVPGNPAELMQQVPVPDLASVLDQIAWVKNLVEQSTAATTTMQGATEKSKVTLGEVELAVGNAQQRIQSMTPFYSQAWHDAAEKIYKLIEGGANNGYLDRISMVKRGARGNSFLQNVTYKELITPHGYSVEALPQNIDDEQLMDDLQKLNVAVQVFDGNAAIKRFYKEKLLEATNLTPEQKNEVKAEEERMIEQAEKQLLAQEQISGEIMPGGTPQMATGTASQMQLTQGQAVNAGAGLESLQNAT